MAYQIFGVYWFLLNRIDWIKEQRLKDLYIEWRFRGMFTSLKSLKYWIILNYPQFTYFYLILMRNSTLTMEKGIWNNVTRSDRLFKSFSLGWYCWQDALHNIQYISKLIYKERKWVLNIADKYANTFKISILFCLNNTVVWKKYANPLKVVPPG